MSPEFGLLLPSRETLLWGDADPGFLIDAARFAEGAGFDSVWAGDSLLARPRFEPLTLLAAVAVVTDRVRLGTAVLLPLLRHPLSLAFTAACLDRIVGGRLILGVGPGADVPGTHAELAALGVSSDKRVGDLVNTVDRCRSLWRGEEEGIRLTPFPTRPSGPPVWLAANGPRMLGLTGRGFDGWFPISPTPADFASGLGAVRRAAEQAGRDPDTLDIAVYLTVAAADTPQQATEELDAYMRAYYGAPAQVMAQQMGCHAGTRASAAEWIGEYTTAGARHVVLRVARPTLSDFDAAAREVLHAAKA